MCQSSRGEISTDGPTEGVVLARSTKNHFQPHYDPSMLLESWKALAEQASTIRICTLGL